VDGGAVMMTVPLDEASRWAANLKTHLEAVCHRIEVAGSIRRGKAQVSDIELVAIPRWSYQYNLLGEKYREANELNELLDFWVEQGAVEMWQDAQHRVCWGEKLRKFWVRSDEFGRIKVDLFQAERANWGIIFLIRTGSADFSKWMVTKKPIGGCPLDVEVDGGRVWRRGAPVDTLEETDVFDLFGVDFVPPVRRSDGLWRAAKAGEARR
jgi:DNA polymerase/3'-5' exonuclease PolX